MKSVDKTCCCATERRVIRIIHHAIRYRSVSLNLRVIMRQRWKGTVEDNLGHIETAIKNPSMAQYMWVIKRISRDRTMSS